MGDLALSPVELEVFRHALSGVADQMGAALRRAAYSPNIKERADCSAAVFDPSGQMIAQAEHIPVHLGAMPASVKAVLDTFGPLQPGQQVCINDPYLGGTHLPDLTMVGAVGSGRGNELLGYVANRAHHADVGGAAPGSMPASASDIAMEGIRIPPVLVRDATGERDDVIRLLVANSRTPDERLGDLRAQFAANHVGAIRLQQLAERMGVPRLRRAMVAVCDYSDRRVRDAVREIPDGTYHAHDLLEVGDGVTIRAKVEVSGDQVTVDFDGTDRQVPANANAVFAVTLSACMFVFRVLSDPDAPPNAGCYRALNVRAPEGSVVNATFPAATAAGNVETSQRIVDVLFRAFAKALPHRVPAAGQGTMNNLLIGTGGDHPFSYYETLGGGEGGTPQRAGMSGVHTGMTNTRNTPTEAMELDYPLRVWCYQLRTGSGGRGAHPGGDGIVREIEALMDCTLTVQSERRHTAPYGLAGGLPGTPGRNIKIHADGTQEELPAKYTGPLARGDRVRIESPGGGGWGEANPNAATTM